MGLALLGASEGGLARGVWAGLCIGFTLKFIYLMQEGV